MTPTVAQLATFRHDLTRIEFALETARAARQRSFTTEAFEAESRARDTLSQLLDVLDVWIDDHGRAAVDDEVIDAAPPQPTREQLEEEAALLGVGMVRHTTSFVHLVEPLASLAELPDPDVGAAILAHAQDETVAKTTLVLPPSPDQPDVEDGAILAPEPEPEPAPATAPGAVVDGKWGIYEGQVKVLRGNKFIRCPEFTCSMKVPLDPDDDTEADVAHAIVAHRPSCLARRPAPTPSKKRAGRP